MHKQSSAVKRSVHMASLLFVLQM